mgnify:CR=1 FL=1
MPMTCHVATRNHGSGEEFQKNYITELYPTLDAYHNAQSYDWQDYIYRTALSHNHHISMTGSQSDLKYTTSLSYDDTQGVIINSGVKRYQGRVNLSQKVNNKLKIDFTGNYASTVQDGPTVSGAQVPCLPPICIAYGLSVRYLLLEAIFSTKCTMRRQYE